MKKTENKTTKTATANETKTNVTINFDALATELSTMCDKSVSDGTKKSLVRIMNKYNAYTTTTATDTVNYNDLYIQLNTTDKPRIWLKKTGFQFQYDKFAKRDNRTEFYEKIATDNGFMFTDTPNYQNRNRTSTMLKYDFLPQLMKKLFDNQVMSTI